MIGRWLWHASNVTLLLTWAVATIASSILGILPLFGMVGWMIFPGVSFVRWGINQAFTDVAEQRQAALQQQWGQYQQQMQEYQLSQQMQMQRGIAEPAPVIVPRSEPAVQPTVERAYAPVAAPARPSASARPKAPVRAAAPARKKATTPSRRTSAPSRSHGKAVRTASARGRSVA